MPHALPEPPPIPEFLLRWWTDKTPEQIQSIAASDDRILWPDWLKIRVEHGQVKEIPCWLRVPNPIEKLQAIVATNLKVAKMCGVDPKKLPITRTEAMLLVGEDAYNEMHSSILMSFCILELKQDGKTHGPRYLPDLILNSVSMLTLYDLYDRLQLYAGLEDVRINELTPEIMNGMIRQISRCMSSAPLRDCSGALSDLIVVGMAQEIEALRKQVAALRAPSDSSSESPSTSTPDT